MLKHGVRLVALTAVIIFCTVLPFLPGRFDSLAGLLSLVAQLFGRVGLVLVPIGVAWLFCELAGHRNRTRHVFQIVAFAAGWMIWLLLSVSVFFESATLAYGGLAALIATLKLWPRVKAMKEDVTRARASFAPIYLIVVPTAVALIQFAIADALPRFSRTRAIQNSAALIADIERYRVANGRYPVSILSVHPDYKPSIIGVREYRYEPRGEAYNVLFENPTLRLGTREIVMYNPRGEHAMTSHALDVLQLTPAQLALDQTRGHNEVHDVPEPNWKYYWFD